MQPQRTALAWQRTGLSVLAGALLVGVVGVRLRALPVTLVAVALGVAIAVQILRRPTADRPEQSAAPWPALVLMVGAVVALGLTGAAAGILTLVRR
nr:hypothetical protein [Nakamurella flavida]